MDVLNLIIHSLEKNRNELSVLRTRDDVLPTTANAIRFVEQLRHSYSKKTALTYGVFNENETSYPFQTMLRRFLEGGDTFVEFTTRAMQHFKAIIDRQPPATGGYVIFGHYGEGGKSYMFCCMLNDTRGFTVDSETLELLDSLHLDIEQVQVASRIAIDQWNDGKDTYLSFAKGKKELSQYFQTFIGCTSNLTPAATTQQLRAAVKNYLNDSGTSSDDKQLVQSRIYDYCVQQLSRGENASLQVISALINGNEPNSFSDYVAENEYTISSEFRPDKQKLRQFTYLSYKSEELSVNIANSLVANRIVEYNAETNTLVIHSVPSELSTQFQAMME